jgi:hypothetical protein
LVPLVTLRTAERPPLPIGTTVRWADDARVVAEVRAVTPALPRSDDQPDDVPHQVELALLAGHVQGTRVPIAGVNSVFTILDPNPHGWAPTAGDIPWTHRSSRQGAP